MFRWSPKNEMVTTVWYPHGSKKGDPQVPVTHYDLDDLGLPPWCHDLGTPQIGTDRFFGAVARPGKAVASSTASISMSPKVVTWVSTRCWVSFRSCLVEGWNLAGMKTWKFRVWRRMNFLGCYFVQLWWDLFSNSAGKLRTNDWTMLKQHFTAWFCFPLGSCYNPVPLFLV